MIHPKWKPSLFGSWQSCCPLKCTSPTCALLGDRTDKRKLLWHNPHLQFVKLFNWPGKAENSSLKAFHCSCLTLPCCVRTGECFSPKCVLLALPNFREVQYQDTFNLWVLTLPEVWQSGDSSVWERGGMGLHTRFFSG